MVHSAGVAELGPVAETPAATWRLHFDINVVAVAELTRLLLPASKFALRAFGDVLRGEEPRLRVTSVYPGRTATEMQRAVRAVEGEPYEPERYLQPESVAGAVLCAVTAPEDAHLTEIVLRPDRS